MIDKESVYRDFYPKVFSYVRSRISSAEDAEDIAADVFLKVYAGLERYDPERAGLSTWIYAITRNTVIDRFKGQKNKTSSYDDAIGLVDPQCSSGMDELLERLDDALDKLPQKQRDVIILRYYFGFGHKEIAQKMGMSYVSARKLCSLALAELRKTMKV